jgi:TRAP-type uncharacterized transport system substrate-binding protein
MMYQSKPVSARCFTLLLFALLMFFSVATRAESIVTGGTTGTYYKIGMNLRDIVSPALEVKDSKGSWANIEEISQGEGVSLGIVQADVYSAFVHLRDNADSDQTRQKYTRLLAHLRVFMPLYKEEVHFLVRKDDPMEFVHQIKDKKIWMDVEKSGTFLTAMNIYGKMFNKKPDRVEPFIASQAIGDSDSTKKRYSALMALSAPDAFPAAQRIDVMVLVGGQPLPLLKEKVPPNLKLLKFDPSHTSATVVLQDYQNAYIQKSSYPQLNIQENNLPVLSVDSYLITADFAEAKRNQFIQEFADQFCAKFGDLQVKGHEKWKALTWRPGSPLPSLATGWRYSDKVKDRLVNCQSNAKPAPRPTSTPKPKPIASKPASSTCSDQFASLGYCKKN